MLLTSGKAQEALATFKAVLEKEPRRLGAMLGARVPLPPLAMPPPPGNIMRQRSRKPMLPMESGPSLQKRELTLRSGEAFGRTPHSCKLPGPNG
jgi:hypothetical protein